MDNETETTKNTVPVAETTKSTVAYSKPKWKRMKLARKEQDEELMAAKFYLNLQNTSLHDRSVREAMARAGVKYSTHAEHRIRTKAKRLKDGSISSDVQEGSKLPLACNPKLPLVLHPKLQDRIRVTQLPKEIMDDLKVIDTKMTEKVNKRTQTDFRKIVNTNLKQWIVKQDFYRLFGERAYNEQSKAFKKNLEQFITGNALMGMGVLFDEIDMSLIYTASNKIVHQTPHFDYEPIVLTQKQIMDKEQFAWIMLLPLTSAGCWVTVWTGPGVGTNMKIKFEECLFLRSDVVHAGGRREIENESDTKFVRLHCYLPTACQKPDRDSIYTLNFNGSHLQDTYWVEDVPEVATSSAKDRKRNKDDNSVINQLKNKDDNNTIKQLNALIELLSDMKSDVENVGINPIKIVEECTANLKKSLGK